MTNQNRVDEIAGDLFRSIQQSGEPGTYPAIEVEKLTHSVGFQQERAERAEARVVELERMLAPV